MSLMRRLERGQSSDDEEPRKEQNAEAGGSPPRNLSSLRSRRISSPNASQKGTYAELKTRVQNRLLSELSADVDVTKLDEVRRTILDLFEQILAEENIVLTRSERQRLFEQIADEILGLGPLQPLLADDSVTEIMVNGPKNIYVERAGRLQRVPVSFENNQHLMRIIDRIVAPLGRRVDEASPYVDARLPDGSRVNAVIPPVSLVGPTITIRKFSKDQIGRAHV